VFTAFALMFSVMGGYFAVRPIRETVGTILGEAVTSDTWIWTAVFAIAIIPVYGFLVARVSRATLVPAIYGFVAAALATAGLVFHSDPQNMVVGRIFYVGISVINLFLISVFWSFLLEFFQSEQTKRLFGFIAAGGTTGALVGPFITDRIVNHVGISGILFFGAVMFVTPGPGIFPIVLGIFLADFPGKNTLQQWILCRPKVINSMNWFRRQFRRPPLQAPCAAGSR